MKHARWFAIGAVCWACPSVAAQDDTQPAVLAGPEVEQDRPARLEQGLTMQMASMTGQLRQLPQQEVRALLERLNSAEVELSLRLTPTQQSALQRISRTHNLAVRAHQEANADEYARLRVEGGYQAMQPLTRDQITPEIQAARAAFRELVAQGPTNADLQTQLFAELTDAQRAWLDEEMARVLAERERAALEARYAEALSEDVVTIEDFLTEGGAVDLEALPKRLRDRLERLRPDQRLVALRRLMSRRTEQAPAQAPAQQPGRGRAEEPEKPAPDLSEIEVPAMPARPVAPDDAGG